jgi:hypothetical protein
MNTFDRKTAQLKLWDLYKMQLIHRVYSFVLSTNIIQIKIQRIVLKNVTHAIFAENNKLITFSAEKIVDIWDIHSTSGPVKRLVLDELSTSSYPAKSIALIGPYL